MHDDNQKRTGYFDAIAPATRRRPARVRTDSHGRPLKAVHLRSIYDGRIKIMIDDGGTVDALGYFRPGQQRQQIVRNLAKRTASGAPVFYLDEPCPELAGGLNGPGGVAYPVPVAGEREAKESEQHQADRDANLSRADDEVARRLRAQAKTAEAKAAIADGSASPTATAASKAAKAVGKKGGAS